MSKSRSGAPRRVAAGLLAGALTVLGVALAPPAGAVDDVQTNRVAGPTRYSTAGAIAGQDDFNGATTAILATGENFPDALAASGLAGGNTPAPIILTETNTFTDAARIAMTQVESLDDVIAVGGTAAITDAVLQAVEDEGYSVTRVAGVDRYETAAAIAGEMNTIGQIDGLNTAFIASGEVFADALAGGPLAYAGTMPVLLVTTDGIPASTTAALAAANIEQVVLLGGTARITDETETELEALVGNPAIRRAGADRFATAAEIARYAEAELGWAPNELLLANGLNFPDALSCGPLGGERSAPILLTASIPEPTATYIDETSNTVERITACGGTAAISDEDIAAADTLAQTTANDAAVPGDSATQNLDGPELQDVNITGFDPDDLVIILGYTFDEDIDNEPDASDFLVYGANTRAPGIGSDVEDVEVNGELVEVAFEILEDGGPAAAARLGAVVVGAVEDEDGNVNPPQSVTMGGASTLTGNSSGPSLADAEVTDEDENEVTFTFDSDLLNEEVSDDCLGDADGGLDLCDNSSAFQLVMADGYVVEGDTAETAESDFDEPGTRSTEVIVTFDEADFAGDDDVSDARRAVAQGDQTSTNFGPGVDVCLDNASLGCRAALTTVDMGSGNTAGPDLDGLTLPADDTELDDNQVVFIFDEDVTTATGFDPDTATLGDFFRLYYASCDTDAAPSCEILADTVEFGYDDDDEQVLATFPDDSINELLAGASVQGGAVESDDVGDDADNGPDEEAISASLAAGEVVGPQLSGVTARADLTGGGNFNEYQVTFAFNRDLTDDDDLDGFSIWVNNDDGEVEEIELTNCDVYRDSNVRCTDDDDESEIPNAVVASVDGAVVFTDEAFTLGEGDESNVQPNPEGSFGLTAFEPVDTA